MTAPATTMDTPLARVIAQHGSLAGRVSSFPCALDTIERLRHEFVDP